MYNKAVLNNSIVPKETIGNKLTKLYYILKYAGLLTLFPVLVSIPTWLFVSQTTYKIVNDYKKAIQGITETEVKSDWILKLVWTKKYEIEYILWIPICYITELNQANLTIKEEMNTQTEFWHAPKFELIPWQNIPTKEDISKIIKILEEILTKSSSDIKITIIGEASPEWMNSDSLDWQDKNSYEKNKSLAIKRAEYIMNELIIENPKFKKEMFEILWVVKTLTQDEINILFWIAQKLNINTNWKLSSINELVTNWNTWNIISLLSEDEQVIMKKIFSRKVTIETFYNNSSSIFWTKENITKFIVPPIFLMLSLMSIIFVVINNWIYKTENRYKKLRSIWKDNLDKKQLEEFLKLDSIISWNSSSIKSIIKRLKLNSSIQINWSTFKKIQWLLWFYEETKNYITIEDLLKIIWKLKASEILKIVEWEQIFEFDYFGFLESTYKKEADSREYEKYLPIVVKK